MLSIYLYRRNFTLKRWTLDGQRNGLEEEFQYKSKDEIVRAVTSMLALGNPDDNVCSGADNSWTLQAAPRHWESTINYSEEDLVKRRAFRKATREPKLIFVYECSQTAALPFACAACNVTL